MCRLLAIWNKDKTNQSKIEWINPWIDALKSASSNDCHLQKAFGFSEHDDGWGVIKSTVNLNNQIGSIKQYHSLKQFYIEDLDSKIDYLLNEEDESIKEEFYLFHVRKATPGTPKKISQTQPFKIYEQIYLSHNGSVNKGAILELLRDNFSIEYEHPEDFSDTQILNHYISLEITESLKKSKILELDSWKAIYNKIITKHKEMKCGYTFFTILLVSDPLKPYYIASTFVSEERSRNLHYYDLYLGKNDGKNVICSSTVKEDFEPKDNWNFERLEENCLYFIYQDDYIKQPLGTLRMIKFVEKSEKSSIQLVNGKIKEFNIIFRLDPLTNQKIVILPHLGEKLEIFTLPTDWEYIEDLFKQTADKCPFCDHNIFKQTPVFGKNERIIEGESVVFPNLYPQYTNHSVVRLTKSHKILPYDFTPKIISDGIQASIASFKVLNEQKFVAINWNYLFQAGATINHPHFQLIAGPIYPNFLETLISKKLKNHKIFIDLIREEKNQKARYLFNSGTFDWFVPFAPTGNNEINAYCLTNDLLSLNKKMINELALIITKLLNWLSTGKGISSYNLSIFSVKEIPDVTFFKLITRQNVSKNARNDINFMSKILKTDFINYFPEDFAEELRMNVFTKL